MGVAMQGVLGPENPHSLKICAQCDYCTRKSRLALVLEKRGPPIINVGYTHAENQMYSGNFLH